VRQDSTTAASTEASIMKSTAATMQKMTREEASMTTSTTVAPSRSTGESIMVTTSTTAKTFTGELVKAVAATSKEAATVFAGNLMASLEEKTTPTEAVVQAAEKTVEVR